MLHIEDKKVKNLLLKGEFGLEKENLRITGDGFFSHTPHPFSGDKNIVRDFAENQIEINTGIWETAEEAVEELAEKTKEIKRVLHKLPEREYIWPFSNPPYIKDENDIPVAVFYGDAEEKTLYRNYLADRYGKYKMTFSGIHFNYSFSDELLQADFKVSGEKSFRKYKDDLYVELAQKLSAYGWILTALTAASPLLDGSFVEKGGYDKTIFNGMASTRCSEVGYWNFFVPVFDYEDAGSYADSIQSYVDEGWIGYASELYFPVRLKPAGINSLNALKEKGVNHIELRMFDLNPLVASGIDIRDIKFARLLIVWLASAPMNSLDRKGQIQAVQNFKNGAHFDLETVNIVTPSGKSFSGKEAALSIISDMKSFYREFSREEMDIIEFEEQKLLDIRKSYAWQIREIYGSDYVKKGLELVKSEEICNNKW